jgi:hypothetical protein
VIVDSSSAKNSSSIPTPVDSTTPLMTIQSSPSTRASSSRASRVRITLSSSSRLPRRDVVRLTLRALRRDTISDASTIAISHFEFPIDCSLVARAPDGPMIGPWLAGETVNRTD